MNIRSNVFLDYVNICVPTVYNRFNYNELSLAYQLVFNCALGLIAHLLECLIKGKIQSKLHKYTLDICTIYFTAKILRFCENNCNEFLPEMFEEVSKNMQSFTYKF